MNAIFQDGVSLVCLQNLCRDDHLFLLTRVRVAGYLDLLSNVALFDCLCLDRDDIGEPGWGREGILCV